MEITPRLRLKFKNKGVLAYKIHSRVEAYFAENKLSKKGGKKLLYKALVFLLAFFSLLAIILFVPLLLVFYVATWILLAVVTSGIGFVAQHDANHKAFSEKKWINNLFGHTLNLLGANRHLWILKHNLMHHHGTNVIDVDEDIEGKPLFRFHKEHSWYWIHQFQHYLLYWSIGYGLLYLFWVWVKDFQKYFSGKILQEPITFSIKEHIIFWFSKIYYWSVFLILPIHQVGVTWWAIGYGSFVFVTGFVIAIIFQLAHIVDGAEQETIASASGEETVEHQISTTADFAVNNNLLSWYVGGLNFQREHHLFPGVAHIHYPAIHKIIVQACKEENFSVLEFSTLTEGIHAHVKKLKELGKKPKEMAVQL